MSSKMLLDNIKRYSALEFFKLVNIEQYLATGKKLPPQIHSVPAIMFKETKAIIFGKQVFDYLLLPGKGFLLNLPKKQVATNSETLGSSSSLEPSSYSLHAGTRSGDAYSFIESEGNTDTQKGYVWSHIDEQFSIPTVEESTGGLETSDSRSKKSLPDISALRSARELDLQNHVNSSSMPPPAASR
jgi:hypothetical protein